MLDNGFSTVFDQLFMAQHRIASLGISVTVGSRQDGVYKAEAELVGTCMLAMRPVTQLWHDLFKRKVHLEQIDLGNGQITRKFRAECFLHVVELRSRILHDRIGPGMMGTSLGLRMIMDAFPSWQINVTTGTLDMIQQRHLSILEDWIVDLTALSEPSSRAGGMSRNGHWMAARPMFGLVGIESEPPSKVSDIACFEIAAGDAAREESVSESFNQPIAQWDSYHIRKLPEDVIDVKDRSNIGLVAEQTEPIIEHDVMDLQYVSTRNPRRLEVKVEHTCAKEALEIDLDILQMVGQRPMAPARHCWALQHLANALESILCCSQSLQSAAGRQPGWSRLKEECATNLQKKLQAKTAAQTVWWRIIMRH